MVKPFASLRRALTRYRVGLLFVFGIGLILAPYPWGEFLSLKTHPQIQKVLDDVLPRLGDALMIGPLLALVVEIAAAQELLDKSFENVFQRILGFIVPYELREPMMHYLPVRLLRTDWLVLFKVDEMPAHPRILEVSIINQYRIKNRTTSAQLYEFRVQLSESLFPQLGEARIRNVAVDGSERTVFQFGEADIRTYDRGGLRTFSQNLTISPGGEYRFVAETTQYFPEGYEVPCIASLPTLRASIQVHYPKDRMRVKVWPSFDAGAELRKIELSDATEWHLDYPILPGQCFFVSCTAIANESQPNQERKAMTR